MKSKDITIGHNRPPKSLEEMINDQHRVKIAPDVLKLLKPMPDAKGEKYLEQTINDTNVIGFKAKANPSGSISFFYQYTPKGVDEEKTKAAKAKDPNAGNVKLNPLKIHLGNYFNDIQSRGKGITPALARKLAVDIRDAIKVGRDPLSIVAAQRKAKTVGQIYDEFIKVRLKSAAYKKKTQTDMISRNKVWVKLDSSGYKQTQIRQTHKGALTIGSRKMLDLTKDDYVRYHTAISYAGKTQANRCIEDLRLVEKYALEKSYIKKTVCHFKKKELNKELKRIETTDPYTLDEYRKFRRSALKIAKKHPRFKISCFALLACPILGARSKSMLFSLPWDNVKMINNEVKFHDTKNDETITLRFKSSMKAVFRVMLNIRHGFNPRDARYKYVFPTQRRSSKKKHIQDPRKVFKLICKDANIPLKCIHFLRHTWATFVYEVTGDIYAVQEMGGWKDIKSVIAYAKLVDRRKNIHIENVDKYMNSHAK